MRSFYCFIIFIFFLLFNPAYARDIYQFPDSQAQERFDTLTHNLRCLVCQNQTIADSQAPLAADLRQKIYEQILNHRSDDEITNYLTQRYGEFILYTPQVEPKTWILWYLPVLIFCLGILGLVSKVALQRTRNKPIDL